jgi:hypothetical protein
MNNYNKTLKHLILNKELEKTEGVINNEHTGNIGYTRYRTKTNKIKDATQKAKKMSNMDSPNLGMN